MSRRKPKTLMEVFAEENERDMTTDQSQDYFAYCQSVREERVREMLRLMEARCQMELGEVLNPLPPIPPEITATELSVRVDSWHRRQEWLRETDARIERQVDELKRVTREMVTHQVLAPGRAQAKRREQDAIDALKLATAQLKISPEEFDARFRKGNK
jgi:hypothetical protein